MPKPTFLQAVLHKPSRSYATADAPSPWSDDAYERRAPAYDDYPRQRQPSLPTHTPSYADRLPRPSPSVVSAASDGPKPRRRAKPSSSTATGVTRPESRASNVSRPPSRAAHPPRPPSMPARGSPSPSPSPRSSPSPGSSVVESAREPLPPARPARRLRPEPALPEPGKPRQSRAVPPMVDGLFTPPDSDLSSTAALTPEPTPLEEPATLPIAPPGPAQTSAKLASPSALADPDESDDEVFYTPRSSLEDLTLSTSAPLVAPVLQLQPPTPAPLPDPVASPLDTASPAALVPALASLSVAKPRVPAPCDDDSHETMSTTSDAGSAVASPYAFPAKTPQPAASTPESVSPEYSRPSSRRSSWRGPRPSYDEFVVHRRNSLAPSEGSTRSASAYGKGGWAAAAAASRAASPVMFMPTGRGDGWTDFQAPPRQSRFMLMPPLASASRASDHAQQRSPSLGPPSIAESLPSAYSQLSDDLVPSRSYLKRDPAPSRSDSDEQGSVPPSTRPHSPSIVNQRPQSPSAYSSASAYDLAVGNLAGRVGLERPSFLNPDTLTFLPEMSAQDSDRLYRAPSESGRSRRSMGEIARRPSSVMGGLARYARSEASARDEPPPRRAQSVASHATASRDGGVLMESHGRDQAPTGYTNLVLPSGAYNPAHPTKFNHDLDARILGLPHATMAAITLNSARRASQPTPAHLRAQLPPPVDFSSHIRPPTKVGDAQVLVQIYAVAVDVDDIAHLDHKGQADVGKWVPGRSFVGRCLNVGVHERELIRGDIVIGLLDLRKSGALAEYLVCDRRRIARAPSTLTIEQLALLPLQGLAALRATAVTPSRGSHALILDAHTGVAALVCQALSRSGVCVTAVIAGGDSQAQARCMAHGARGVLIGSASAVMHGLEEEIFDYVLDTVGGQRVYDAARRVLKDGGRLVTLCDPDPAMTATPISSKSSGIKTFRAAFASRRKTSKFIAFEHVCPPGTGEPELDASGLDRRDMLEEARLAALQPVVGDVVLFEKGASAFQSTATTVVRLIN